MKSNPLPRTSAQRGVTLLVVLMLMTVMLTGGLALARITEISALASGNSAFRETSLQASEVGVNSAFDAVKGLADESVATGNWYWPIPQAADASGIPGVAWDNTPELVVGAYRVRYAVERLCTVASVTDTLRQCLVKQVPQPPESNDFNRPALDPPNARQFRITVRVFGPKDTQTWVQSLVYKG